MKKKNYLLGFQILNTSTFVSGRVLDLELEFSTCLSNRRNRYSQSRTKTEVTFSNRVL